MPTSTKLHNIEQTVSPLMRHYLAASETMAASDITLIGQIHSHIQANKGKQLRPLLTIVTACCCGLPLNAAPDHPLFRAAAALETLHTSTLIHDDVVDSSNIRRGAATVNTLWNNKTAVLMGDFYLAQVMKTINEIDNKQLTSTINNVVIEMSEGELLQQQYSGHFDGSLPVYMQIIGKKTATLISACCKTGAIMAGADEALCQAASEFGTELGIAFQMRDDIIDFIPTTLTGKPQGNDIRERKCTLPLILALKNTETQSRLMPMLRKDFLNDSDIASIINTVTTGGFLDQATAEMHCRLDSAVRRLDRLPDNSHRQSLNEIVTLLKEF